MPEFLPFRLLSEGRFILLQTHHVSYNTAAAYLIYHCRVKSEE